MVMSAADGGGGEVLPPDLELNAADAAKNADLTAKDSYDITLKLPLTKASNSFSFWFNYVYQDPETNILTEGPRSPIVRHEFNVPNLTKGVLNLTLVQGFKSYGIKFDLDPTSIQEDIVIFESLTGAFTGEQYIVYVGNSTNVTINTSDFAPRWVMVRARDKWLDANKSDVTAGPVTPKNADPDTSTPPAAPSTASVVGSIDSNDKSGFSGKMTVTWSANTDTNTSGYAIRWSSQNPATVTNPLWEYGQVDGKSTTTFEITGLTPNTTYYWQVTAKSPYNAISWASPKSGTLAPIVDPNAPSDTFAQLRSVLSIGGKTADLFKIGTGIAQDINTSITITPSLTTGTYNGIILNKSSTNYGHNYWLNTGQFRVGSATSFLYWSGSDLYTTGKINATGGSFTGDVQLNGGSLYAGALPNTGARVRLNSSGIFAYDANNAQTVAITQSDGKIDARQGYIGGWTINATSQQSGSISRNNTIFDSSGNITVGDTAGTLNSIVRLSGTDPSYRIWVGSQSASTAKFKVGTDGTLYATNAVIGTGSTVAGYVSATSLATTLGSYVTNTALSTTLGNYATTSTLNNYSTSAQIAAAYLPTTGFSRTAVLEKLIKATGGEAGKIDGGLLQTGTVTADYIVADYVYTGVLTGNIIRTQVSTTFPRISLNEVFNQLTFHTLSGHNPGAIYGTAGTGYGILTIEGPHAVGGEKPYINMYSLNTTTSAIAFTSDAALFSGALTAGGNVIISGYTRMQEVEINSTIYANTLGTTSSNGQGAIYQDSNGYLKVRTGTGSSIKLKDNVAPFEGISNYSNLIKNMNLVTFNYKPEVVEDPWFNQLGMIVEDLVQYTDSEFLIDYKDGEPAGIYYEKIPLFLVGAFKEMCLKIEELESKLDALQG
jgi:hypothetical protein